MSSYGGDRRIPNNNPIGPRNANVRYGIFKSLRQTIRHNVRNAHYLLHGNIGTQNERTFNVLLALVGAFSIAVFRKKNSCLLTGLRQLNYRIEHTHGATPKQLRRGRL